MRKEKIVTRLETFKRCLGYIFISITAIAFFWYIRSHPNIISALKDIGLLTIVGILVLYTGVVATNGAILYWSVQLCQKSLSSFEALVLTTYSSLVNFFGPLQSGPGFRVLYLKKKHSVNMKPYALTNLLYYAIFGFFSLELIIYGVNPLLSGLVFLLAIFILIAAFSFLKRKYQIFANHPTAVYKIALITCAQILVTVVIYLIELHVVAKSIALSQAAIYTGAANLALFVSLTPGAIGFRESFLLFSTQLHHIPSSVVLSASIIDRAVYFVFLGLLFIFSGVIHTKDILGNRRAVS